jgi:small-conductance mechanosensitive channel
LESVAFKVEGTTSKADAGLKMVGNVDKRLAPLEEQLSGLSQHIQQTLTQNNNVLSSLEGLELKIKDIEASQDTLKLKIIDIEGQIQKIQTAPPEIKVEQPMPIPVMPIKRDKALAALTDTEIAVLEMLSKQGPKTAPEIKEVVHLSREHTARLMKKLYESGYVEREEGKIPFRYSIKKEMENLLQKIEAQPSAATN